MEFQPTYVILNCRMVFVSSPLQSVSTVFFGVDWHLPPLLEPLRSSLVNRGFSERSGSTTKPLKNQGQWKAMIFFLLAGKSRKCINFMYINLFITISQNPVWCILENQSQAFIPSTTWLNMNRSHRYLSRLPPLSSGWCAVANKYVKHQHLQLIWMETTTLLGVSN